MTSEQRDQYRVALAELRLLEETGDEFLSCFFSSAILRILATHLFADFQI